MNKVLPGSSREALGFIGSHWPGLLKMSIIPVAAQLLVSYFQLRNLSSFYRSLATMVDGKQINPEFFGAYFKSMGLMMVGSIVALCLMGLLFVQVVRFRKSGEASWLLTDKEGIKAGLLTLAYAIGIVMLTVLIYVGVVIGVAILSGIMGLLFHGSAAAGAILAILLILFILGMMAFLYWFMFRFFVGLPGVALGHSPDFFRDMWPLSRGESWGIPMRMFLATFVMYIPLVILMAVFMWPMLGDIASNPALQPGNDNPMAMMPLMADMMERMMPVSMLTSIIMVRSSGGGAESESHRQHQQRRDFIGGQELKCPFAHVHAGKRIGELHRHPQSFGQPGQQTRYAGATTAGKHGADLAEVAR